MFQQNPTNLYAASCFLYGILVSDGEIALEGVTKIEGIARSAPAKQSSKLGIWPRIYPELARSDAAKQPWELDIWILFQPEAARSAPAKQSSELDIWRQF